MQSIDPTVIVIAGGVIALLAVVALTVVVLLVMRAERGRSELTGRIAAMTDAQVQTQGQLAQKLIDQERMLNERLADVSRRVGESIEKQTKTTHDTMTDLRERLARIDAAQKNIAELSTQVVSLQDILSNKQARGAFGEVQLKDLVEAMLPPSAYTFQATVGEGRRVDCLIRLPNPPGPIGIDAKFPLESYRALRAAEAEPDRVRASRDFSAAMLKHVHDIRDRYIVPGETADAALMFLPSEAVYAELHANFGNVVEQSFRERVFIVSPTTLWATLNTVRAVFRDVRMREQAHVIQKELHVMLKDVERLAKRVDNLESHFNLARRDVDEIKTSAGKVTRRAERIQELEFEEDNGDADTAVAELAPRRRIGGE